MGSTLGEAAGFCGVAAFLGSGFGLAGEGLGEGATAAAGAFACFFSWTTSLAAAGDFPGVPLGVAALAAAGLEGAGASSSSELMVRTTDASFSFFACVAR